MTINVDVNSDNCLDLEYGGTGSNNASGALSNIGAAANNHLHTGVYSANNHLHAGVYSDNNHLHTGTYSDNNHLHTGVYSDNNHNHDNNYSALSHNHDGTYSANNHNHVGVYSDNNHAHNDYMAVSNIGNGANNYLQLSATPGTANNTVYLRGDMTWATPPGGNATPGGNTTEFQINSNNNLAGVPILTYANNKITLNGEMALSANGSFTGLTSYSISPAANNGEYGGIVMVRTAGENLAYGDIVYYKNDSKIYKSNATNSAGMLALGVVCVGANNGNNATILTYGAITSAGFNFAVGNLVYPSKTAGTLTDNVSAVNGNNAIVQPFGRVLAANCVFVNPSLVGIEITS